MSCRVLGRRVEEAALATVAKAAKAKGAKRLIGEYFPTAKNAMVSEHFKNLGFVADGEAREPNGGIGTRWRLDLADYRAPELPMEIRTLRDEPAEAVTEAAL